MRPTVVCLSILLVTTGCEDGDPPLGEAATPPPYPPRADLLMVADNPPAPPMEYPEPSPTYLRQFADVLAERRAYNGKVDEARQKPAEEFMAGKPPAVQTMLSLYNDAVQAKVLDPRGLPAGDRDAVAAGLRECFGTSAAPQIKPLNQTTQRAIGELKLDAGTLARGGRLYRNYCMTCHGLTGNGRGPTGLELRPMPRDYRQGVFKFVTSDPTASVEVNIDNVTKMEPVDGKPRRADLERSIRMGMPGAGMPPFDGLPDGDIQALVSHVIYLSLRGQAEYRTLWKALNYPFNAGEWGLPFDAEFAPPEKLKAEIGPQLARLAKLWLKAEASPIEVPADPYPDDDKRLAAAARGYKLYYNEAGCAGCHIQLGAASTPVLDRWGTVAKARSLLLGVRRGGYAHSHTYARLYGGIKSCNMVAQHVLKKPAGSEDPIWDLVHLLDAAEDPARRAELEQKYNIELDRKPEKEKSGE